VTGAIPSLASHRLATTILPLFPLFCTKHTIMAEKDFLVKYLSLPDALKKEVSDFLDFLFQKYAAQKGNKKPEDKKFPLRKAGTMKGLITFMAEDFDAPLDDFKEYI
jgi:uncharacterized protein DUF2281